MYEILGLSDIVWGLVYFLLLFIIVYLVAKRKYKDNFFKKIFIGAFLIRMLSAFFYIFLYKVILNAVTDTGRYYYHSLEVREQILSLNFSLSNISWSDSTNLTGVFAGFIGILTPGNYLCISLLFTVLGFIGSWKIFSTFNKVFPNCSKKLAISILFMPSLFFWGSSLMKDPLCVFGLGLTFSAAHSLFILNNFKIKYFLHLCISIMSSAFIKPYIPLLFLPCLIIWIARIKYSEIKNKLVKISLLPIGFIIIILVFIGISQKITSINENLALENAGNAIKGIQDFYNSNPDEVGNSAYNIGTISPNLIENVKLLPNAFIVTYLRPYLWEAKKILYLPTIYEVLFTYYFLLIFIFKIGIFKSFKIIKKDKALQFCLLFAVLFGCLVGLTSFNFGTLMRYKIPALPFWTTFLIIVYEKYKNKTHSYTA
jgi:hypothetical protein